MNSIVCFLWWLCCSPAASALSVDVDVACAFDCPSLGVVICLSVVFIESQIFQSETEQLASSSPMVTETLLGLVSIGNTKKYMWCGAFCARIKILYYW